MTRYAFVLGLIVCLVPLQAQQLLTPGPVSVVTCTPPDTETARAEDIRSGRVPRFALPTGQSVSAVEHGAWTALPNGGYVWRIAVTSPGAHSLILLVSDISLDPGAYLLVRDREGRQVESYFPRRDRSGAPLTIGPVAGDRVELEYFHPEAPAALNIDDVYHGFTPDFHALPTPEPSPEQALQSQCLGFGCSLPCQVNVNCLQTPAVQHSRQSVVRMLLIFQEGASWCSGALVNNQRQDGTPYILSAFHCQYGYNPNYQFWAYFFRYETQGCPNPVTEPNAFKVTGSQLRAKWSDSDFLLLEITAGLPQVTDLTYAGWNRTDQYKPFPTYFLHHPSADILKVSVDSQAATIWLTQVQWSNGITTPGNHHYRMYFDLGTSEPGSSGGPLFDMNGHIIGQLNGGSANCQSNALWFGRFQRSWNGGGTKETRLRDWLDPDQTGITSLNEKLTEGLTSVRVSGKVLTPTGTPVPGAQIHLSGNSVQTVISDASGHFEFPEVEAGFSYVLTANREGPHAQGISVSDLVLFNKYLVGSSGLPTLYSSIAADVNASGTLSIGDLILIRRILIGDISSFPNVPSWAMFRSGLPVTGAWEINNLLDDLDNVQFVGVKMGDINHSVQP